MMSWTGVSAKRFLTSSKVETLVKRPRNNSEHDPRIPLLLQPVRRELIVRAAA
jgi:hypothetical protein